MSHIAVIAGARPNFMKVAPILEAFEKADIPAKLIHTGQHYDKNMSDVFFRDLGIPEPDVHLEVGSASHSVQTANIMIAYEKYCLESKPSWTLVVGDVNSTVACSLVAAKLGIKVCHLEAGLRSNDWSMPEEINRVVTDRLSQLLLTPSPDADENLLKEGVDPARIHMVGNIMIDYLLRLLPRANESTIHARIELDKKSYILGTFHRPSNVDSKVNLLNLVEIIEEAARSLPFVLPVHPRTRIKLEECGLLDQLEKNTSVYVIEPQGYIDFLALSSQARVVMTDSGGIQEETTVLGIPCLTLRENTERPITIMKGTNRLVGTNKERVLTALNDALQAKSTTCEIPELWDGNTASRCAEVMQKQAGFSRTFL